MKTSSLKTLLAAVAVFTAGLSANHAALLLYDGFESNTLGGLSGKTGGTAAPGSTWGNWATASAGQTVVASSLSYSAGSVAVSGGTKAYQSDSGAATFLLTRDYTIPEVEDGDSIYVSYLMRATNGFSGDDTFTQAGLYPSTNWGAVTQLKSGVTDLGVRAGAGSSFGSTVENLMDNTTYFVVQQYTISGGDTTVSTWLNPTSTTLGTPAASATAASMTFTQLRFRGATGVGTYLFDEVRIGTSVADVVVPEPGAVSLIAAGTAVMILRRRSRRA